ASAAVSVGVRASRCARAAISGTTPPYRACSSIDDAMTFASSRVPRTTPTPVSSQLVSIPRTRGSRILNLALGTRDRRLGRPNPQPHHESVDPIGLVVGRAHREPLETESLIEFDRARVVGAH